MEMRVFGRSGMQVSLLGFGCGEVGGLMVRGAPADQERAIARAIEVGVNYFDTAVQYGDGESEKNLGRALRKLKPANAIAGNPSRNEKRAASSLLNPSARAAVKVEPERDTPGISAPICAIPTSIASTSDTSLTVRRCRARTSAMARRIAMATQAQPITPRPRSGEGQAFNTPASAKPAMPIGMVASTIQTAKRKCRSSNFR